MRRAGAMLSIRVFALISLLILAFQPVSYAGSATALDTLDFEQEINSYILKDIGTSEILMSKNTGKRVQPASLTKILTAIMAIESGKLGEYVVIQKEATVVEPTKAGLQAGEMIRLVDLVKASMVRSSNDAAFSIAIYLGGSVKGFARMMNRKARQIGMSNSNFTNPAGFDRDLYAGHYSTALDLLRLSEYAIGNEIFNRIAALDSISFFEQNTKKKYSLKTSNKLLGKYRYAVGIKTGYTMRAGRCLIARAKKDKKDMVLVMLKTGYKRWALAEQMFEKGFSMRQRDRISDYPVTQQEAAKPLMLLGNELQGK